MLVSFARKCRRLTLYVGAMSGGHEWWPFVSFYFSDVAPRVPTDEDDFFFDDADFAEGDLKKDAV
jgi:hypothetical protein